MQLEEQRSMISTARRCLVHTEPVALQHGTLTTKSLFFPRHICLQLGMHCQYLCGDMLTVEKWRSLLETLQLEADVAERENWADVEANNNRCLRSSSEAPNIREHPQLGPPIQAFIHPHVSPFQHRHFSESWQRMRPRLLQGTPASY